MLIPSIDLMGGKIVQLVQGKRKALEFDNFGEWVRRFQEFPIVQLIDLDAAMQAGSNRDLVEQFCAQLPCQVGGGLRTIEAVSQTLARGAKKAIIGSSLFSADGVNEGFAQQLASACGTGRLIFAVDSRNGYIAVNGWKQSIRLRPTEAMQKLDPFCSAFLYTHIDTEGTIGGFPWEVLNEMRQATTKKLIVAGGIANRDEVNRLDALGVDAVVGMAIYTGTMQV